MIIFRFFFDFVSLLFIYGNVSCTCRNSLRLMHAVPIFFLHFEQHSVRAKRRWVYNGILLWNTTRQFFAFLIFLFFPFVFTFFGHFPIFPLVESFPSVHAIKIMKFILLSHNFVFISTSLKGYDMNVCRSTVHLIIYPIFCIRQEIESLWKDIKMGRN